MRMPPGGRAAGGIAEPGEPGRLLGDGTAMALTSLTQPSRADRACACALLGPNDPLARVFARLTEPIDQLIASGVIACAAALWLAKSGPWGTELVVAACLTLSFLACRLAILIAERNDLALEPIICGGGDIPLETVARLRSRLLDRRARRRLARTIAAIRDASTQPPLAGVPRSTLGSSTRSTVSSHKSSRS